MIADLVHAETLGKVMVQLAKQLEEEEARHRAGDADTREAAEQAEASEDDVREARAEVEEWEKREAKEIAEGGVPITIPRSPVASLVQSVYEEFFLERQSTTTPEAAQGLAANEIPDTDEALDDEARSFLLREGDYLGGRWGTRFAERDVRFITWGAAAKIATWARGGRHAFNETAATHQLGNSARVLLVGDWGSGAPRARTLAAVMRTSIEQAKADGKACHVVHLGDVYYTGQKREYKRHFLDHWPVTPAEAARFGSWGLNGNHDMYSGGYAYFDFLLADPRFAAQQKSSYFALENDHWQILGLDTAYDDNDLHGPQIAWATAMRMKSPKKKGILLSHHQPFSSWEKGDFAINSRLAPLVDAGLVTAWFWGHEHRCALYAPRGKLRYPRVVGHGGVPVWASKVATPADVQYEFREAFTAFINERFARFGFVQLDFQDARITASYISELGQVHHTEVIE